MELSKDGSTRVPVGHPRYDKYDWYLQWPTLASLASANGATNLPSWTGFRTHPAWDAYWQAKAMQRVWTKPTIPVLMVGGFWDQEDMFGPQEAYRALEANDRQGLNHIVLGPWFHGMWAGRATTAIGPIDFGSNTGLEYRSTIERPWFAHWLHGTGDGKFPEAWVFESGENAWHTFDAWPPKEASPRRLYLRENGGLSFDAPTASRSGCQLTADSCSYDSYISDPAHPVPYMPRPIDGTKWREWLVQDQRFVDGRPDVATWQTTPLAEDVTIAGNVVAHLFASTTGTDADWVVKLIDVYPDSMPGDARMGGYELMVASDIMRGRYREGWSKAVPIPANSVVPFTVDLHQQLYRFKKGHRIMVQVQSTWFPLYDRNPQTFVPNIFEAKPQDFRARTHRVWHAPGKASYVAVGVMN
jgi:putative CocE/NonD family hydrolase